jgi:hypothetical protein
MRWVVVEGYRGRPEAALVEPVGDDVKDVGNSDPALELG